MERRTPPARDVRGALAAVLVEAAELRRRCGTQPRILVETAVGRRPLTVVRNRLVDVFILGAGELLGVPATPWRVGAGCAVALGGTLDVWALRRVVVLFTEATPTAFLATNVAGRGGSDALLIDRAPGATVVVRTLGARGHCAAFHRRAGVKRFCRVFAGLQTVLRPRRALVATATTKGICCPVTCSGAFAPPAAAPAGIAGCTTGDALGACGPRTCRLTRALFFEARGFLPTVLFIFALLGERWTEGALFADAAAFAVAAPSTLVKGPAVDVNAGATCGLRGAGGCGRRQWHNDRGDQHHRGREQQSRREEARHFINFTGLLPGLSVEHTAVCCKDFRSRKGPIRWWSFYQVHVPTEVEGNRKCASNISVFSKCNS